MHAKICCSTVYKLSRTWSVFKKFSDRSCFQSVRYNTMLKHMQVGSRGIISAIGCVFIICLLKLSHSVTLPCSDRNFMIQRHSWIYTPKRVKYLAIYCIQYSDIQNCLAICHEQDSCIGVVINSNHTKEECSTCRNIQNSANAEEKELSKVMNGTNFLFYVHQTHAGKSTIILPSRQGPDLHLLGSWSQTISAVIIAQNGARVRQNCNKRFFGPMHFLEVSITTY